MTKTATKKPLRKVLRPLVLDILKLAVPIVLSRLGLQLMSIVDTMMVGHFSTRQLAYQAISLAPFDFILLTAFGLMTGTLIVCSNRFGARQYKACGAAWRLSVPIGATIGIAGFFICLLGEQFLLFTGQKTQMAYHGSNVLFFLGLSLPPALIFMACAFFLEAIKKPMIAVYAMLAANIFNYFLNKVCVYGMPGILPPMGAVGSAWATAGSRYFLAAFMVAYILMMKDHAKYGVRQAPGKRPKILKRLMVFGLAAGGGVGIEEASFAILILMVGWLGTLELSAFSITLNIISVAYTLAAALGTATAAKASAAYGRGNLRRVKRAGWIGFGLTIILLGTFGLLLSGFATTVAGFYTTDAEIIALAPLLFAFGSAIVFFDGGQLMMTFVLRAREETWFPTIGQLGFSACVMIPLAWYWGTKAGYGLNGIYSGWLVCAIGLFILFCIRFIYLCKQDWPAIYEYENDVSSEENLLK